MTNHQNTQPEIALRPAVIEDLSYIISVYNETIPGGEVTADTVPVTEADWRPWFENHRTDRRPVWILLADNKLCGWMSFSDYKSRPAYDITAEVSIYLEPAFRGKGLGRRFLDHGLQHVNLAGVRNVLAVIFSRNTASKRLFERAGFETWGVLPKACLMDQLEKDVTILGKRL